MTWTFSFSIPKVEIISIHIPNTHRGCWADRPRTCRALRKNANWICFGSSPPRDASQPLGGSWSQALKGCSTVNPLKHGHNNPEPVALRAPLSRLPHRKEMRVKPRNRHSAALKRKRVGIKMLKLILFTYYSLFEKFKAGTNCAERLTWCDGESIFLRM